MSKHLPIIISSIAAGALAAWALTQGPAPAPAPMTIEGDAEMRALLQGDWAVEQLVYRAKNAGCPARLKTASGRSISCGDKERMSFGSAGDLELASERGSWTYLAGTLRMEVPGSCTMARVRPWVRGLEIEITSPPEYRTARMRLARIGP